MTVPVPVKAPDDGDRVAAQVQGAVVEDVASAKVPAATSGGVVGDPQGAGGVRKATAAAGPGADVIVGHDVAGGRAAMSTWMP